MTARICFKLFFGFFIAGGVSLAQAADSEISRLEISRLLMSTQVKVETAPPEGPVDLKEILKRHARSFPAGILQRLTQTGATVFYKDGSRVGASGTLVITLNPGQNLDLGSASSQRIFKLEPIQPTEKSVITIRSVRIMAQGGIPKLFFGNVELSNLKLRFFSTQILEKKLVGAFFDLGEGIARLVPGVLSQVFQGEISPIGFSTHWGSRTHGFYSKRHFLFI